LFLSEVSDKNIMTNNQKKVKDFRSTVFDTMSEYYDII
jgi:hypothetical protein